jgi:hypothetical protein
MTKPLLCLTRCGWIFNWWKPQQDCGLPFRHHGPHVEGDKVQRVLEAVYPNCDPSAQTGEASCR